MINLLSFPRALENQNNSTGTSTHLYILHSLPLTMLFHGLTRRSILLVGPE